ARACIASRRAHCVAKSKRSDSSSSLKAISGATPRMRATFRSSRRAAKRSTSSCSSFRSQCERPPAWRKRPAPVVPLKGGAVARKSTLSELLTAQAEQGDWGALEDILLVALDQEVQLTPGLAKILLAIVRGERTRERGQPAISVIVEAVMYSVLLELEGLPIKAAIHDTSELFGVSRSSIYTARKRM